MTGSRTALSARPLRVGYVIGQLTRGGAERQLYELARGIDRGRFQCVVYCLSRDTAPFGEMIAATGVTVRTLPRARRLDLGRVLALARLARTDDLDILHSFLVHASGYAWPAQRLAGVPHLITSARNCRTVGTVRDWIVRRAFRASDAIVCNGEAVREFIAQRYGAPARRCRVIHNGVDFARFSARPRAGAAGTRGLGPTIVTVGRLVPQKDLSLFLEAAALLRRDFPTARFWVIGDGPCRSELERATAALGLGESARVPRRARGRPRPAGRRRRLLAHLGVGGSAQCPARGAGLRHARRVTRCGCRARDRSPRRHRLSRAPARRRRVRLRHASTPR